MGRAGFVSQQLQIAQGPALNLEAVRLFDQFAPVGDFMGIELHGLQVVVLL